MSHYKSNLRDIEFNLFEFSDLGDHLASGDFGEIDSAAARDIVREVDRLAREEWADSFVDADRNPPRLVDGEVELPASLKRSLDAYFDAGWEKVSLPVSIGGFGGPAQLRWAMSELLYGGNATASFYLTGVLIASVIHATGTAKKAPAGTSMKLAMRKLRPMMGSQPESRWQPPRSALQKR